MRRADLFRIKELFDFRKGFPRFEVRQHLPERLKRIRAVGIREHDLHGGLDLKRGELPVFAEAFFQDGVLFDGVEVVEEGVLFGGGHGGGLLRAEDADERGMKFVPVDILALVAERKAFSLGKTDDFSEILQRDRAAKGEFVRIAVQEGDCPVMLLFGKRADRVSRLHAEVCGSRVNAEELGLLLRHGAAAVFGMNLAFPDEPLAGLELVLKEDRLVEPVFQIR